MSGRSLSNSYRYLIVAVWAWPFLVAYLYAVLVPYWRRAVLVGAAALAAFNVATTAALIAEWRKRDFAARVADLPDLRALLTDLRDRNITHCYASMWLAFRITYESDEAILCSPPYNERFFGWPLPYKERVDAAARAPFILTDTHQSRFTPSTFEQDLVAYDLFAENRRLGIFHIFDAFSHPRWTRDVDLDTTELVFSASHNSTEAGRLRQGFRQSVWSTTVAQAPGMWVQIDLGQPRPVHRVTLYCTYRHRHDLASRLRILVRRHGVWSVAREDVPARLDRLRYVADHPLYGDVQRTIWFEQPVLADAVRLEVQQASPGRPWAIAEIGIGSAGPKP